LEGYALPVTGFFHSNENPADNGMAFGGIGTGCMDIESDGTIGFMSVFNSLSPRRGPVNMPMFGVSAGTESYLLSTRRLKEYPEDAYTHVRAKRACPAKDILYFGHYPMLDMEYLLPDSPVEVSSRMFVPFLPGNAPESNIPGGVMEFYIRNVSGREVEGNLCMSFPGPSAEEACGNLNFTRRVDEYGDARIITVRNNENLSYSIGVSGSNKVEHGGCLGVDGYYWSHIGLKAGAGGGHEYRLPYEYSQPGCSVSAGYSVGAGRVVKITFVLAWYAASYDSSGSPVGRERGFAKTGASENFAKNYFHMYSKRFDGSLSVAKYLVKSREDTKRRIIAWQSVIYGNQALPGWLKDSLINSLYVITEDSVWVRAAHPIGAWCGNEDGLFAMNECPRGCPQMECIPCSFYGTLPVVYFFPELAKTTVRAVKEYQFEDGATPWIFGGVTAGSAFWDLTTPARGYQITSNGISYAVMVDRLVRHLNDRELMREFYLSLKRNMVYTMGLNPEPDGVISMPNRRVSEGAGRETEWFECNAWDGMAAHVGGLHLAQLRIVERMAAEYGDAEFAERCAKWIGEGQKSMEEKMWAGSYYLNSYNEKTGVKSDLIFGYQLDGELIARFHGLGPVFDGTRVTKTLETIEDINVRLSGRGAINFATPKGEAAGGGAGIADLEYDPHEFFPAELLMLAMTYMLDGKTDTGMELAHRCMREIVCAQGRSFNSPNIIRCDRTESAFGNDYYQVLMIWGLPAAAEGSPMAEYGAAGSFIDRIIKSCQ